VIICELFCNLDISLVNACGMKCFVINLLNNTVLIILQAARKQAKGIIPIRELQETLG